MAGLIDVEAEWARLQKQFDKQSQDRDKTARKLENESFVNRAPTDVVEKERSRLSELDGALAELGERLQRLESLRTERPESS